MFFTQFSFTNKRKMLRNMKWRRNIIWCGGYKMGKLDKNKIAFHFKESHQWMDECEFNHRFCYGWHWKENENRLEWLTVLLSVRRECDLKFEQWQPRAQISHSRYGDKTKQIIQRLCFSHGPLSVEKSSGCRKNRTVQ